jgi:hypothetical protein
MEAGEQATETEVIVEVTVTVKLIATDDPPPGAGFVTTTG